MKKQRHRTWTPEQRARQAEIIREWQPWTRSTGPRTKAGKAIVSTNADKGEGYQSTRQLIRMMGRAMRTQRDSLSEIKGSLWG